MHRLTRQVFFFFFQSSTFLESIVVLYFVLCLCQVVGMYWLYPDCCDLFIDMKEILGVLYGPVAVCKSQCQHALGIPIGGICVFVIHTNTETQAESVYDFWALHSISLLLLSILETTVYASDES